MENNFNLKKFLIENKLTQNSKVLKEGMTIVGHTPEEKQKNAEELVAKAKELGFEANIEYNNGEISNVQIGKNGLGSHPDLRDIQDRQFDDYDKNKPKNDKPSFKPKRLKQLTVGGKTYEKGADDPNDDGKIESIEKYPNGYYITGGIYSDYGDGDDAKEGYGYAIDLDGNEMDEEDLEGMYENKQVNEIDPDLLKRAQNTPAPKDAADKLAKRKADIDNQKRGTLTVSMGPNAEEEQKVIDIARDAIALMDEQPGTSAITALETVLENL